MTNARLVVGVVGTVSLASWTLLVAREQQRQDPVAEAFKGVTTNGTIVPGLFPVRATGFSTGPVREAAVKFLAALTDEQRKSTTFPIDDDEWRKWNNIHRYARQGVSFKEMSESQRALGFALMQAGLSAKGFQKSRDVMRLNGYVAELVKTPEEYGEYLYHLTVMGTPSDKQPWGWQLDGHHLIINYFVLGDQVVMTPAFMGSEPVSASTGQYAGTKVLQGEQDMGLAFMQSLSPEQQKQATIQTSKTGNNALSQACGPYVVPEVSLSGRAVYTHNPFTCAFRGFGVNQMAFAMEQQMNKLAAALALDPALVRRRNFVRDGAHMASGSTVASTAGLPKTLTAAAARAPTPRSRSAAARSRCSVRPPAPSPTTSPA